eukprot:CAMPEP_0181108846 /NCGR_PEP_ID=MMETSP1071-20121207/17852_1 /TAXON_ID=35127 /ORGANISM="Thalassiosira sp., Strain NH16" /LENGTH=282 /DNA_ID=CAMNT_0023192485 /DNA_START=271 /DNA_END=1119 /DNA_ORIENTATION=+
MSSAFYLSTLLRTGRRGLPSLYGHQRQHRQQLRHKHQVRVILTRDLPEGQMRDVYAGEVHDVAAGYARNYLVPKKMAVYATPRNFERCGLVDPALAAEEEEAKERLLRATGGDGDEDNEELKAADILTKYLRNKSVKIIRNTDPNQPIMCHPGHVSAKNLRDKLAKQLKIDLEDHETIHIRNEPVVGLYEKDEAELFQLLQDIDQEDVLAKKEPAEEGDETRKDGDAMEDPAPGQDAAADNQEVNANAKECDAKVKQIGDYVAKITLEGGYVVPLKFTIVRR